MDEIEIRVEVEVNPTESEEKVRRAVENVLGPLPLEFKPHPQGEGGILVVEAKGFETLSKFYNLLRRERICDAARTILFEGLIGDTIIFYLNKQVAYVGHISFSKAFAESPLGPIKVQVRCSDPRQFIDWLAPKSS
ncbi:MAG: RNA-binding domain-containing protein [Candidatus Bathyarchaeia archaeon]|nr:hypothetical protein [Candidatus Bathyarchaeota archaeon]